LGPGFKNEDIVTQSDGKNDENMAIKRSVKVEVFAIENAGRAHSPSLSARSFNLAAYLFNPWPGQPVA